MDTITKDDMGASPIGILRVNFEAVQATGLPDVESGKWCVWRAMPDTKRPSKFKKLPMNATGGLVSSTRPGEWLSYDAAKAAYLTGGFEGVGLLMGSVSGVVGIDLDGVTDAAGEVIEGKTELVSQFVAIGGYIERSPSGYGLRQFVQGRVPDGYVTNNGAGVEVYDGVEPRFLTVTGQRWGGAGRDVEAGNHRTLDTFVHAWMKPKPVSVTKATRGRGITGKARTDDEVIGLLLGRHDRDGQYQAIYSGQTEGKSECRGALLKQLAYFTRDDEQIERIVRGSALNPEKLDEKRNGFRNRLHYEISRMLEAQTRNHDEDIEAKAEARAAEKANAEMVRAKAAERLHGVDVAGLTAGGKLKADLATVSDLLINDRHLLGVLWFDSFSGLPRKSISFAQAFADRCAPDSTGCLEDDDVLAVSAWLRKQWGVSCSDTTILRGAIKRWARATTLNPVAESLQSMAEEWDGRERLRSWLADYLGANADGDEGRAYYLAEVGTRFLVGVVARALKPGAQQDQMLVLENSQGGEGKSAAVRILARAISEDAYLEGFSPSNNKDTLMQLRGKVLASWDELSGYDKRESEWNKAFLTATEDTYRDPYGSFNQTWKRTVSFIATSNRDDYLSDMGGRRRYWPVRVGRIDLTGLALDVRQLWGEAVRLYQAGERHWIDPVSPADARFRSLCDVEQRGRLVATAYDDMALDLANRLVVGAVAVPNVDMIAPVCMIFSVSQMQRLLFSESTVGVSARDWGAMAAALKRCGWSNGSDCRIPGGNKGWRLSYEKALELSRINEMAGPEPYSDKADRGLRKQLKALQAA